VLTVVDTDSHTQYCLAIPIKAKSDVAITLSYVIDLEAKRFVFYLSVVHSDRGTEFINQTMKEFCKKHLIRS
jgi:hypothetical protein